jgi:arabinan endo-1,5-alpha-L-arabinosidase
MKLSEIQIRDPFVLPVQARGEYYLFGSTDKNIWRGPGGGFDCYRGRDLENWDGPIPAFRPSPGFWANTQFWAAEVHEFKGRFFMFATFKADGRCRGTQILAADQPEGPFEPWSDGPVTPAEWECLDGTLHVDKAGDPWMVFCHEWVQVGDGEMIAVRLAPDLRNAIGQPVKLFTASRAPWVRRLTGVNPQEIVGTKNIRLDAGLYVTDGPFLHRAGNGALLMLWSSFGDQGYAMGLARSVSDKITGPWTHDAAPLWAEDGGHGMFLRSFAGELFVTLHRPNKTPNERATFHRLEETTDSIRLVRTT